MTMTLAAKCAPDKSVLSRIAEAGIGAVELYTNMAWLKKAERVGEVCRSFSFRYALHAPNDGCEPEALAGLAREIEAEVVVFHNIYWEQEWEFILSAFVGERAALCLENTFSAHEPLKYMRRFGLRRCVDVEHLQMECCGVYEAEFVRILRQAYHVHLTGYQYNSALWHTHLHHSPKHSAYFLNLLADIGYAGMVVSEAGTEMQTAEEFRELADFFNQWRINMYGSSEE